MAEKQQDQAQTKTRTHQLARSVCPTSYEARNLMVAATAFTTRILQLPVEEGTADDDVKKACKVIYLAACQGFNEASLEPLKLDKGNAEPVATALASLGFKVAPGEKALSVTW